MCNDDPAVKQIAMSGGGSRATGQGCLFTAREIGAHAVLAKRFEQQDLLGAVRALLH